MLFKGEALIQGEALNFGKNDINFYLCNFTALPKFIKKTLPKITDYFYRKLLAFFTEKWCNFTDFYPTEFTVTELILLHLPPITVTDFFRKSLPTHPYFLHSGLKKHVYNMKNIKIFEKVYIIVRCDLLKIFDI